MKKIICFFILMLISCSNFVFANESLDDGLYKVDVALWHAYEDKPSMGNPGIDTVANIFVNDGNMQMYIGVKEITFANITTSVSRFFYADNLSKVYKLASTYVFEIKIEEDEYRRPRIFSFPLENKSEFFDVLIDPKVEQMGNDPIKARLKVDWSKIEKISENDSLYSFAINDKSEKPKYKEFNENGVLVKFADFVFVPINILKLSNTEVKNKISFNALDEVYVYKISKNEEEIPFDKDAKAETDELYNGIDIDFLDIKFADRVYLLENEKLIELEFIQGDFVKLKNAKTGIYVLVDYAESISGNEINNTDNALSKNISDNDKKIEKFSNSTNDILQKENNSERVNSGSLAVLSDKSLKSIVNSTLENYSDSEISKENLAFQQDTILEISQNDKEIIEDKGKTNIEDTSERWDIIFLISFSYILCFAFGVILIKKYLKKILFEIDRMLDINRKMDKKQEGEL